MVALKQEVGPFVLESSKSGSHRYLNQQPLGDGTALVYPVEITKEGDAWTVVTGLYAVGQMRRKPEQVQEVERLGAPIGTFRTFKSAKQAAYRFMRRFSGSPGYNGLVDLAEQAGI